MGGMSKLSCRVLFNDRYMTQPHIWRISTRYWSAQTLDVLVHRATKQNSAEEISRESECVEKQDITRNKTYHTFMEWSNEWENEEATGFTGVVWLVWAHAQQMLQQMISQQVWLTSERGQPPLRWSNGCPTIFWWYWPVVVAMHPRQDNISRQHPRSWRARVLSTILDCKVSYRGSTLLHGYSPRYHPPVATQRKMKRTLSQTAHTHLMLIALSNVFNFALIIILLPVSHAM